MITGPKNLITYAAEKCADQLESAAAQLRNCRGIRQRGEESPRARMSAAVTTARTALEALESEMQGFIARSRRGAPEAPHGGG